MKRTKLLTYFLILIGLIAVFALCKRGFNIGFNDGKQNREINK